MLNNLCPPAMLYVAFSMTQVIIDIFKNLYNTALLKFMVMIVFSITLNILCKQGLTTLSWFIVFIPFVIMTIITSLLLFVFGLSPSSGSLQYDIDYNKHGKHDKHNQHRLENRYYDNPINTFDDEITTSPNGLSLPSNSKQNTINAISIDEYIDEYIDKSLDKSLDKRVNDSSVPALCNKINKKGTCTDCKKCDESCQKQCKIHGCYWGKEVQHRGYQCCESEIRGCDYMKGEPNNHKVSTA